MEVGPWVKSLGQSMEALLRHSLLQKHAPVTNAGSWPRGFCYIQFDFVAFPNLSFPFYPVIVFIYNKVFGLPLEAETKE